MKNLVLIALIFTAACGKQTQHSTTTPLNKKPIALTAQSSETSTQTKNWKTQLDHITATAHNYVGFEGAVLLSVPGQTYQANSALQVVGVSDTLTDMPLFSVGSIGKEFTTIAIMRLKDTGRISLDDKIVRYLDNLPTWAEDISIENLLNHSSGLPRIKWKENIVTNDVVGQINDIKSLNFAPGKGYKYSNLNVVLRALIIEKITGQPFDHYARETLFDPAGMTNTISTSKSGFSRDMVVLGDYATDIQGVSFYSNVEDLLKWETALWNGTLISRKQLVQAIKKESKSGQIGRAGYDFGSYKSGADGKLLEVSHDGSNPSHHALKYNDLKKGHVFTAMSADGRKATLLEIKNYLWQMGTNDKLLIPGQWWLSKNIQELGFEVAFPAYLELVEAGNKLLTSEETLNSLGYQMMSDSRMQEATILLAHNLKIFPQSANAHDSYADVLVRSKKYMQAEGIIAKGLELARKDGNQMLTNSLQGYLKTIHENRPQPE
jgi:CubicO group peptidase (beta-lactamase class C family)